MIKYSLVFIFFCIISFWAISQEATQFRGLNRSGIFEGVDLLKQWPGNGPALKLKIEGVGKGYSSVVYYKNTIYVTGIKKDTLDVISAYNLKGNLLWEKSYGRAWANSFPETRSTPTIDNDKIYLAGGMGVVVCLDANSGEIIWSSDAHSDFKGEYHKWGVAESILLTKTAAVYVTGGVETAVVALNKHDGSLVWKTKSSGGPRAYASPTLILRGGLEIILAQTANDLLAINSADGEILWGYNLIQYHTNRSGKGGNTNPPLYSNGEIFVTSGYDHGGLMFSLAEDGKSAQLKWKSDVLDNHHGGVVLFDGNIYGANWQSNSKGKWACIDWETGNLNWEEEWFNKGSIVSADNLLYLFEEKSGNLALVKPDDKKLSIISSFKITDGEGPYWAHPSIYEKMLFVRHGDIVLIFDIKA